VVAGFTHVRRSPELQRQVTIAAIVIGISGLGVAAQYSLVQALREPPSFLGVLSAALGAGSIVSSLTSAPLLRRVGESWLAVIGSVDFAVRNLLRATGSMPAVVAGSLLLGFALPWVFLAVINLAQRTTPNELKGRVSAMILLAIFGPQASLQALGSLAIEHVSYQTIYIGSAARTLAAAAADLPRLIRQALGAERAVLDC
jgi:hypothetical protein